jgi:uncharacterized protein YlzI (FlbEa/FlbD family)
MKENNMKILKLSLNVHDATTSGKEVYINPEHIVSIRPYTYSSGNYIEITLVSGEKFQVKDTVEEIGQSLGTKKWL